VAPAPPWAASGSGGVSPATERAGARPEEPYGRRRVAPRGVTGTPPAGERRGLVPERPANAAVAGPVSAGFGKATTAPGLPPARAGLSVSVVDRPRCWGKTPPHPLRVAPLQWRSSGLSLCPVCCHFESLGQPALLTSPSIHGEAFCSPARPCCSSSWEGTQYNRPCAPASRPEAHAPLPIARNGSPP
jgi:hypothetical protein